MDRFVTKRPRDEAASTSTVDKKAKTTLPDTIALCSPVQGICSLEADALRVFDEYDIERWYNLGFLPRRQLLFGSSLGSHRTPHCEEIPQVLLDIFSHARDALIAEAPRFGRVPNKPSSCAINRYETTSNHVGNGLGPHRDQGKWKPLVVGVTLVESRDMAFSNDYKEKATLRYQITTARGSVYAFRDDIYTRWYHESLKKGRTQKHTIYSITYRFACVASENVTVSTDC